MANYCVDNFVSIPSFPLDPFIKVYKCNGTLSFSIDPYLSSFTQKNRYIYIIVNNNIVYQNTLDFSSEQEAMAALDKLGQIKKIYSSHSQPEPEKDVYSKAETDVLLMGKSDITHKHSMSGLTDVYFSNLQQGDILFYNGTKWTNSGISIDLSNYYTKQETYNIQEVYNTGETYTKQEILNLISGITISGSTTNIIVKDQNNSSIFTGVTIFNFIGYNPTSNVRVLDGGEHQVDIWIKAPDFVSHFNSNDGTNDTRLSNYSTTSRYISSPISEGNPFKIGSWISGTTRNTIRNSVNLIYTTPSTFSILNTNTTFSAIVLDADDVTEIVNHTIILSGNNSYIQSGITISVSSWSADATKFKAIVSVTFNMATILPQGGRFSIKLQHDDSTDGIYTFSQTGIFRDNESTTASISNINLAEGFKVTKYISGVKYYTTNTEWIVNATNINNLNDKTYPLSEQMEIIGTSLGLSQIDNIHSTQFTGWTGLYNITGVSYYISNWKTTTNNYFIATSSASVTGRVYDWTLVGTTQSNQITAIIDTYIDSSDRNSEMFRSENFRKRNNLITNWSSSTDLKIEDDGLGLQVYNDRLVYPTINFQTFNPDFSLQPNYSTGISGDRTYYRRFWSAGSTSSNGVFLFTDYNITESDLSSDNIVFEISPDSGTTWFNLNHEQLNPGQVLVNGDNCRVEVDTYKLDASLAQYKGLKFTLGLGGSSVEICLKITYKSTATTKYLGGLDLTSGNWD